MRWTTPAALGVVAALAASGCSSGPAPSHVDAAYRGVLSDDTMVEAATTVLVTTAPAVIAVDCGPLAGAIRASNAAAVDGAVAQGNAARIPAGVTLYTPPFSPQNPKAAPFVVTDDKHGGTLCTPGTFKIVKE